MSSKFAARFVAIFTDGSSGPITIMGYYGRANMIGLATRGDGYRRVILLNADQDDPMLKRDPWIKQVERIPAAQLSVVK